MIISFQTSPNAAETVAVSGDMAVIGRGSTDWSLDVNLLADKGVSRIHAAITWADNEFWIEDLASTNGTRVDGRLISGKTLLPPGARIQIGATSITVEPDAAQSGDAADDADLIGDIAESVDAAQPPFVSLNTESSTDALGDAMRQLKALHDVGQALGQAESIDDLLRRVREQIQNAIPTAGRGAVLLSDRNGNLLMKTHWPEGQHSVSMTWARRARDERQAFIWSAAHETGEIPKTALFFKVKAAVYAPLIWEEDALGVIYVDSFADREAFAHTDLELLRTIANETAMFIQIHRLQGRLRGEERLQASLLRQFPPHVASRLLSDGGRLRPGGRRADPVTILLADVRGFTALSARLEADALVQMLNEMYSAFIPIIFKYDGVVEKYEGDSVLAVFGSPEEDEQQWQKAVAAALEMQAAQQMLSQAWQVRNLPPCQMGIGIHTGSVIHGFIGAAERMEFTIIGEAVNRTARISDGAAGGEVIISKQVYERVFREVDVEPRTIVGKHPESEASIESYVVVKINVAPERTPAPDELGTRTI